MKLLITGAAGRIGRTLASGLSTDYELHLADLSAVEQSGTAKRHVCDVTSREDAQRVAAGMDAVVHLAGHPNSRDWSVVQQLNIGGTLNMLEAAKDAGVKRFVYASSVHSVGLHPADVGLSPDLPLWPDSPYGVSKAAGETLVRYFSENYGMTGIAVRICSFRPAPGNSREVRTWISPADMVRLVEACLTAPVSGYRTIWGVSNNSLAHLDRKHWNELGYDPQDDGADHVRDLEAAGVDVSCYSEWPYLGGAFVQKEIGTA